PCVIAGEGHAFSRAPLNGKQHTVITLRGTLIKFVEISNHNAILGPLQGQWASRIEISSRRARAGGSQNVTTRRALSVDGGTRKEDSCIEGPGTPHMNGCGSHITDGG